MAVLDLDRGVVAVRIVYDGAPFAGKTSSLRALAKSLGRKVETPLELAERTVYFDWVEYTGGLFEGHPLHCQILSVPGQPELEPRRRALLELADAVVFVLDSSTEEGVQRGARFLENAKEMLSRRSGPPVGIVVQVNKRDKPGAMAREALRQALGAEAAEVALIDTAAEEGLGIRETFVFAVRLAIDRIRTETQDRALAQGALEYSSPQELLDMLEPLISPDGPESPVPSDAKSGAEPSLSAFEVASSTPAGEGSDLTWPLGVVRDESLDPPAEDRRTPLTFPPATPERSESEARGESSTAFAHVISAARRRNTTAPRVLPTAVPDVPTSGIAGGSIWPPVEGRLLLHEVSELGLSARRGADGHWTAGEGLAWGLRSAATHEFSSFEAGRQELVVWAREHALLHATLSPRRAVVLAETGLGTFRLWQLVRQTPSLRAWIAEEAGASLRALYRRLVEAAALLGAGITRHVATRLRPDVDTFGRLRDRVDGVFVGFMPAPQDEVMPAPEDLLAFVATQLAAVLSAELAPRCRELAMRAVELWLGSEPWDGVVSSAISIAFKSLELR